MLEGYVYQNPCHSGGGISHSVAGPGAAMTGWSYIFSGSLTTAGSYINATNLRSQDLSLDVV